MFRHTNHEVFVLTARVGDRRSGQVATWVVPATLVPDTLRLLVVLSPLNFTHTLVRESGRFVLHLLAADQLDLLPRFGLSSSRDADKFAGLSLSSSHSGIPVLQDTCGWAEMRIVDRLDAGDRIACLCDAIEIGDEPDRPPLRLKDALARLPPDVAAALDRKRIRDGERDRTWMKDFGTPAPMRTRAGGNRA